MNKLELLTVTIAALGLAMSAAHASESTLYGTIDLGVVHATGMATGSQSELVSGSDFPSEIGVKGEENIGSSNTVFYKIATGFCAAGAFSDGKTSSLPSSGFCTGGGFMGRTSMLGAKGAYGSLSAGRFLLPVYTNASAIDPFHNGATGAITNLNRAVSAFNYLRESQLLEYKTPALRGLSATLVYGFGAMPGGMNPGSIKHISINYRQGPLYAGASYLTQDYVTSKALASGAIRTGSSTRNEIDQIFAKYDFGPMTIDGMYQIFKSGFPGSTFTPAAGSIAGMDNKFWTVGATVPLGNGDFGVSYAATKDSHVADSGAKLYAIGYTYGLSKATRLYTSVSHLSNDSAAAYGVHDASNTFTATSGATANGFAIGLRHSF